MADFRKWIIALAVVLLFAGLASAQVGGGASTPLICTAQATTTPTIRQEGITELVGDILITCTGGTITSNLGNGGTSNPPAQQTNFILTLTSQVTSRLLPIATSGIGAQVSEALLLIDEPNSGETAPIPGFGPAAGFSTCASPATPLTGCGSFILTQTAGTPPLGYQTSVTTATATPGEATPGPNTFQGVVQGTQVTFFGVPIVPPGTNGSRVYRIKNVRINANPFAQFASVMANVSVTGISIANPTPIVAFVQQSLTTTVFNAGGIPGASTAFPQCVSVGQVPVAPPASGLATTLRFRDSFPGAFKTRLDATVPGQTALGYPGTGPVQNVPNVSYNSESAFTLTNGQTVNGVVVSGLSGQTGLADFGTRLTAVFSNVPTGVHILVSQFDSTGKQAQAVSSETAPDSNGGLPAAVANSAGLVDITPAAGTTATATWEVISSTPTSIQTLLFNVYIAFVAAPPSPAPGTITVNLRYGPVSTVTTASSTANVPRFLDTSTATNAIVINICRTVLLFPFLTNIAGFDTGLAIANTSTDPFLTLTQSGSCDYYWDGGPAKGFTTPVIPSGTVFTDLLSIRNPGFQGYLITICNFQFAHGFAFVSDLGARNLAMGYLPLVIPDPGLNLGRNASDQGFSVPGSGEQLSQ